MDWPETGATPLNVRYMASPNADKALRTLLFGPDSTPLDAFLRFAEPLFQTYQLDLEDLEAFIDRSGQAVDVDMLWYACETAQLIWIYCAVSQHDDGTLLHKLEEILLDAEADEEDRSTLHVLLGEMEDIWHSLDITSQVPRRPVHDFEAALTRYTETFVPEDQVLHAPDEHERIAFVARLFIENVDPDDFDDFEIRMELAHALFHLVDEKAVCPASLDQLGKQYARYAPHLPHLAEEFAERIRLFATEHL